MANWKKIKIPGNEKPVEAYRRDGFTICLNINKGFNGPGVVDRHGNHWWFEVTEKKNGNGEESYVGEAPTLKGAKRIATRGTDANG